MINFVRETETEAKYQCSSLDICKVSAESKRASLAVRQEKGNSLEGKERVTGP